MMFAAQKSPHSLSNTLGFAQEKHGTNIALQISAGNKHHINCNHLHQQFHIKHFKQQHLGLGAAPSSPLVSSSLVPRYYHHQLHHDNICGSKRTLAATDFMIYDLKFI